MPLQALQVPHPFTPPALVAPKMLAASSVTTEMLPSADVLKVQRPRANLSAKRAAFLRAGLEAYMCVGISKRTKNTLQLFFDVSFRVVLVRK